MHTTITDPNFLLCDRNRNCVDLKVGKTPNADYFNSAPAITGAGVRANTEDNSMYSINNVSNGDHVKNTLSRTQSWNVANKQLRPAPEPTLVERRKSFGDINPGINYDSGHVNDDIFPSLFGPYIANGVVLSSSDEFGNSDSDEIVSSSDIDSSAEVAEEDSVSDATSNVPQTNFLSVSPISTNKLMNRHEKRIEKGYLSRNLSINSDANLGHLKINRSPSTNVNKKGIVGNAVPVRRSQQNAERIRRGYLDRLGIGANKQGPNESKNSTMGVHARRAAMASARSRRKAPSMVVPLKDGNKTNSGFGTSFIRKISLWMTSDEQSDDRRDNSQRRNRKSNTYLSSADAAALTKSRSLVSSDKHAKALRERALKRTGRKAVAFLDETSVIFVPSRREISPGVKARLWHTREEFVDMVMRNMDQVEEEMAEQAEIQARLADIRNNPPPSLKKGKKSNNRGR